MIIGKKVSQALDLFLCKKRISAFRLEFIQFLLDIFIDSVEGLLVHTNRSCKLWSGFMPEMSRQIGEACGIPVVSFDGDQADPRNFSEAQYDTRVQGLMEIMDTNKEAK